MPIPPHTSIKHNFIKKGIDGMNLSSVLRNMIVTETVSTPGGTPILGHIRDVGPEWVGFSAQKPAGGCKFLTKKPADGS